MKQKGYKLIWLLVLIQFLELGTGNAYAYSKVRYNSAVAVQKSIYLTFDDGPTPKITDEILDILKAKNVKATFFVIGNKAKLHNDIIERIYMEGHGIGLHTYTHNYRKIYGDDKAFIDEMDRTSDEICNITGIRCSAIRFPLGSIGHLNKVLYEKLNEKNYKIFDWNARITDGVHPNKTPEAFYKEAVDSSKKWNSVFMLMHCAEINKNTCKALPKIIDYFKKNDYIFKVIDESTPAYFFDFRKAKKGRSAN